MGYVLQKGWKENIKYLWLQSGEWNSQLFTLKTLTTCRCDIFDLIPLTMFPHNGSLENLTSNSIA